MLQKDDYVRYAGKGGLYLWDNECQVRWHNLDDSNRTDWLLFFDVCREDPTQYTEAIIAAIMNGLCPHKIVGYGELTRTGFAGEEGVDWGRKKFWYWREGRKKVFGIDSVPEFTRQPAAYYLGELRWRWVYVQNENRPPQPVFMPINAPAYRGYSKVYFQRRQGSWKVHKFDHPYDAWRFLFQFIGGVRRRRFPRSQAEPGTALSSRLRLAEAPLTSRGT
jgi:hypothetical protein